jgi:hypothetical protein
MKQGIHNVFVVKPQLLVTTLSLTISAFFESDGSGLHGTRFDKKIPPVEEMLTLSGDAQGDAVVLRIVWMCSMRADAEVNVRISRLAALLPCAFMWKSWGDHAE